MTEQKEMNGCGMCKMHSGCHSWILRAFLMIAIIGIVFSCGVATGELKATVRSIHKYGMMQRGGWDKGRMPMMMKGAPADMMNPDDILYE